MTQLKFFHATGCDLQIGTCLQFAWRRIMRSDPEERIDDLLEDVRGGRSYQRNVATFMIGRPAEMAVSRDDFKDIGVQSARYIFELQPKGSPSKHDWNWMSELHRRHPHLIGGKKRALPTFQPYSEYTELTDENIAERYWSGEESHLPRWEYLVDEATVIRQAA